MRNLVWLVVVFLVGCASSNQIYMPSGEQGYALNCSGTARSWNHCYAKAGELCGTNGYDIVEQNGEGGSMITGSATQSNARIFGTTLQGRTMTVQCKPSP